MQVEKSFKGWYIEFAEDKALDTMKTPNSIYLTCTAETWKATQMNLSRMKFMKGLLSNIKFFSKPLFLHTKSI